MGLLIERGPRSPQKKDKELDARRCPYVRQPTTATLPLGRTIVRSESGSTPFIAPAPSATVFRSFVTDMARQQVIRERRRPRSPGRVVPTRIPSPEVDSPESNFNQTEQRRLEAAEERRAQITNEHRQRHLRLLEERFPYLPTEILETHPPIVENPTDGYDLTDPIWSQAEVPWLQARPVPSATQVLPIRRTTVTDYHDDDEDALTSEQLRQLRRLSQLRAMRIQHQRMAHEMRQNDQQSAQLPSTDSDLTFETSRPIQITYHQHEEA